MARKGAPNRVVGVYKHTNSGVIVRLFWDGQMCTTHFTDAEVGNEYADHVRGVIRRIGAHREGHGEPVPDPAPFKGPQTEELLIDPEDGRSWAEILRDAAERALVVGDFKGVAQLAAAAKTVVPAKRNKKGFHPQPDGSIEPEETPAEEIDLGALTKAVMKTVADVQALSEGSSDD